MADGVAGRPADFAFIDADKSDQVEYYELLVRLVERLAQADGGNGLCGGRGGSPVRGARTSPPYSTRAGDPGNILN